MNTYEALIAKFVSDVDEIIGICVALEDGQYDESTDDRLEDIMLVNEMTMEALQERRDLRRLANRVSSAKSWRTFINTSSELDLIVEDLWGS